MSQLRTHGLSCRSSEGRHPRHAAINDIIRRTLSSAESPTRLEPPGLLRSDGKRQDGMTLVPWISGRPLVWDATCSDTFAVSYRSQATSGAGCVAALAEVGKEAKYSYLPTTYQFQPVANETSGAVGPSTRVFLKDLGKRVRREIGEVMATPYLFSASLWQFRRETQQLLWAAPASTDSIHCSIMFYFLILLLLLNFLVGTNLSTSSSSRSPMVTCNHTSCNRSIR